MNSEFYWWNQIVEKSKDVHNWNLHHETKIEEVKYGKYVICCLKFKNGK